MNNTWAPIDEVYLKSSDASQWGSPVNTAAIAPTYSMTVSDLSPGLWDAEAVIYGASSTYYAHASGLDVVSNTTLDWAIATGDFSGSIRLTNGYSSSITAVYVAPSSSGTWGGNELGAPLPPGSTVYIEDLPPGSYDIECDYSDNTMWPGYSYTVGPISVTSITSG